MEPGSVTRGRAALLAITLAAGLVVGFVLAFRLDEEARRRLRKTIFELRELPFRVFL
ncbi:hypothetical protein [Candidatus Solincola tengchongensis]|uniref:hypothetical protein n=1 Tax=Candidatus Solincola tengchongensis TaxID=2900693 RepID=UPI00257EDCD8|nr:hypothetical protein [Candidatus Solincola tengchongensis]